MALDLAGVDVGNSREIAGSGIGVVLLSAREIDG